MKINQDLCLFCGVCYAECEHGAIRASVPDGLSTMPERYEIDHVECTGCGGCQSVCPGNAIKEGV